MNATLQNLKFKVEDVVINQHTARQIVISVATSAVVAQVAGSLFPNANIVTRIAIASGGLLAGLKVNEVVNNEIAKNYGYSVSYR